MLHENVMMMMKKGVIGRIYRMCFEEREMGRICRLYLKKGVISRIYRMCFGEGRWVTI